MQVEVQEEEIKPTTIINSNGIIKEDDDDEKVESDALVVDGEGEEKKEVTEAEVAEVIEVEEQKEDVEMIEVLPEDASEVIYINNLNEQIKLNVLKQSLKTLFRQYGNVLDVVAHRSVRMRGQAFVTMTTKEAAAKAVKEVKGFPLYGKPMQLAFARTESDALVKNKHSEDFDTHKAERLVRKKMHRKDNPLRRKFIEDKIATQKAAEAAALAGDVPTAGTSTSTTTTSTTTSARRIVQIPDEYLPPNKILFVQNLPDETTKETLENLFKAYPNLMEVRTIPGRKNIAFVEFSDDTSSGTAKDALHNTKLGELKLKVSFAKLG